MTYPSLVVMRHTFTIFIVCLCCSCSSPSNKANISGPQVTNNAPQNSEAIHLTNYMIHELMALPSMPPGLSLAISKNDSIVHAKGYGYTHLKTLTPVSTQTQFRLGSLSRLVTITALLKLVEDGRLTFEDHLEALLPEYPKKQYPITVQQLATGLSGMPHYSPQDVYNKTNYTNIDDALTVFAHIPLAAPPGTTYKYSTHSYTLLSKIIEKSAQTTFPDLLKTRIFEPLHMTTTNIENIEQLPATITAVFEPYTESIHENYLKQIDTLKNYSYSWAGAGMISTPTDLVRLGNAYINGFIKQEQLRTVFQIQRLHSGDTIRQSMGWDKNWDMDNRFIFEQDGAAQGARSIVSVFPEERLSIALMANALQIRAIEETAHTLAIPFLTPLSPIEQPKGIFRLDLQEDIRGTWVQKTGTLILDGENDRLILEPGTSDEALFKLVYLNRAHHYALIHPDGILYCDIHQVQDTITGKVMYYRGPNLHKTSTEPPYLKFKSIN